MTEEREKERQAKRESEGGGRIFIQLQIIDIYKYTQKTHLKKLRIKRLIRIRLKTTY